MRMGSRTKAAVVMATAVAAGLATVAPVQAADRTWDDGGGNPAGTDNRFGTAANWNPDNVPVAGDNAIFGGAGIGSGPEVISVAGATFALNAINQLNGTGATSGDPHVLAASVAIRTAGEFGTLTLNNQTSDILTIEGEITADSGSASPSLIKSGSGRVRIGAIGRTTANTIIGNVTISGGTLEVISGGDNTNANPLGGGGEVILSNNGAELDLRINGTGDTVGFGRDLRVGANTTTTIRVGAVTTGTPTVGMRSLFIGGGNSGTSGTSTLNINQGNGAQLVFNDTSVLAVNAILNVNAKTTFAQAIEGMGSLTKNGAAELVLSQAGMFSGGLTVNNGQLTTLAAQALGTGSIVVGAANQPINQNPVLRVEDPGTFSGAAANRTVTLNGSATGGSGTLQIVNAQNPFPQVIVNPYGVLAGNLTNAVYNPTAANRNVTLTDNAILAPTAGNQPTGADLPAGVRLLRGVTATNQNVNLTDPGTSAVYRAVAFGVFTPGDYNGILTGPTDADLNIRLLTNQAFTPATDGPVGAVPNFFTSNDTGVVNVTGIGTMTINARGANPVAVGGNWTTINRSGDASTRNTTLIAFDTFDNAQTGDALPDGKTVNVTNGRIGVFDSPSHIAGTVNVNGGRLTSGASFNFATGTLVVLDGDMNTDSIPENVDIQVSEDTFTGKGIVVGQGRRLTAGTGESVTLVAGTTQVRAATGATNIIFSAGSGQGLTIDAPVNLTGVNLAINDPAGTVPNITPNGGDNSRATGPHYGEVNINGVFRAASVTLQGLPGHTNGTTGQADISVFVLNGANQNVSGNITVTSGSLFLGGGGESNRLGDLTDRLTTTSTAVADRVADNIVIGAGGLVEMGLKFPATGTRQTVTQPFTIAGGVDAGDRRTFFVERTPITGTGTLGVDYQRITMNNGAVLGFQESNTDIRTSLIMAGTGTIIRGASGTSDFDLINVTSSAAGTPRTLNIGVPASTGADIAFGGPVNIFGTISSDVTLNVSANRTAAQALGIAAGATGTINGSIDLNTKAFAASGRLGGIGSITDGTLTVASTGTVAPGNSPGILTVPSTTMANGSIYEVEMAGLAPGTGYDQLNVLGTVGLTNPTLQLLLAPGFVPALGSTFTIINNDGSDPVSGTFAQGGFLTAGGSEFDIAYNGGDGNDVVLTAVPEPAGIAAVGMAACGLLAGRRRRRTM